VQLVPSGDDATSLVYSEKHNNKLRQGRGAKLTFAAASAKERDIWLADLSANKLDKVNVLH
jgi:hypothetical protein